MSHIEHVFLRLYIAYIPLAWTQYRNAYHIHHPSARVWCACAVLYGLCLNLADLCPGCLESALIEILYRFRAKSGEFESDSVKNLA